MIYSGEAVFAEWQNQLKALTDVFEVDVCADILVLQFNSCHLLLVHFDETVQRRVASAATGQVRFYSREQQPLDRLLLQAQACQMYCAMALALLAIEVFYRELVLVQSVRGPAFLAQDVI